MPSVFRLHSSKLEQRDQSSATRVCIREWQAGMQLTPPRNGASPPRTTDTGVGEWDQTHGSGFLR
jgi:hypothetical protein